MYRAFQQLAVSMACYMLFMSCVLAKGLIRDAQTEDYLSDIAYPIFKAAGLDTSQVRMFIVQDERINAFVAGGSNMFLHTGLIIEAETADMLLGVIAHETGHITGGHLVRGVDYARRTQAGAILAYLVGAAVVAAGGGAAGAAIMSGGSHVANRNMLAYTREHERAADQAALTYLQRAGLSADGMLQMFERLRREEKRVISPDQDVYARTHPLSKERITHMRHALRRSAGLGNVSKSMQKRHHHVRGKLIGFLQDTQQVFRVFPRHDTSDAARIARAIAYSRVSQVQNALYELKPLMQSSPQNPYMHELQGHVLFEAGMVEQAIDAYRKATEMAPNQPIMRSDYAKVLLASQQSKHIQEAKRELLYASQKDPTYHQTWRLLARVYGYENNVGMAELSLAELAALSSDKKTLLRRLDKAEQYVDKSSPAGLRVADLRLFAETLDND